MDIFTNREKLEQLFRNDARLDTILRAATLVEVVAIVPNATTGNDDVLKLKLKNYAGEVTDDFLIVESVPPLATFTIVDEVSEITDETVARVRDEFNTKVNAAITPSAPGVPGTATVPPPRLPPVVIE